MYELPLFPLNTVLFPNAPIALHIFEPRYKEMIERCLRTDSPFGVVLIQSGQEALGALPEPHSIGCTARITQVERLEDGRLNIIAVGGERFQIRGLRFDKPYLVGQVDPYPMDRADRAGVDRAAERLRPWVVRYLTALAEASTDIEFDPQTLPEDPLALGYLAAALLQIPSEQKQPLLAEQQAAALLIQVRAIYQREVTLLRVLLAHSPAEDADRLFSLN